MISVDSQFFQLKKELNQVGILEGSGKLLVGQDNHISLDSKLKILEHMTYLDEHQRLELLIEIYPYSIAKQSLSRNRVLSDLALSKDK